MADPQSNAAAPAHPPLPPGAPRSGVIHIRHRHTDRFTVVGNHLAQHPSLSAVAIGLAVYIQSLPDGVSATVKALALRFREGETTIARALNELEGAGYLERRRVPLGGGRMATRTLFHDRPGRGTRETPSRTVSPQAPTDAPIAVSPQPNPEPRPQVKQAPPLPPPAQGPAAGLLAHLRLADPRLLLSTHDVRRLAPAVDIWLARSATPGQIIRTLTASLPPASEPIHHPARFLEHRLTALVPPPLASEQPTTAPATTAVVPLQTCDGCERAFRSHDPTARCRDCRPAVGVAA